MSSLYADGAPAMTAAPSTTAPPTPPVTAPFALCGTLCHTPERGSVEVLQDTLVIVSSAGNITYLGLPAGDEADKELAAVGLARQAVRRLGPQQFLLPGFIDAHVHAPQFTFTGVGTDLPLLDWLHTYTFPAEAAFADSGHAAAMYTRLVRRLLRLGSTTANYFGTIHTPATNVLVDVVAAEGQRAVIGKVCMDQHAPASYVESSADASLAGAAEVADYIQAKGCNRIMASIIPRFIPTCSPALLEGLGRLAARHGLRVHTHISESRDQVAFSQHLHPGAAHDAAVYDAAGLLRPGAVFAHGTQLTDDALRLLAARSAALAHCPLSNFYFGDGLLCVARALAFGVRVGLGTDVAAGYSPSMLQAMRLAVINSHALKAARLMAQQQEGLTSTQGSGQPHEQAQQQQAQEQAQAQEPDPEQQRSCECDQQLEHRRQEGSSVPHGQAAGLAGSRAAAAITIPEVSTAALQHMLSWEDALHLATAGGADALGIGDRVGRFGVGMAFDALLVDCGLSDVFDVLQRRDEPLVLLESFLNNGDDRNIRAVWVQGRLCHEQ